jgi:hypothetical protein
MAGCAGTASKALDDHLTGASPTLMAAVIDPSPACAAPDGLRLEAASPSKTKLRSNQDRFSFVGDVDPERHVLGGGAQIVTRHLIQIARGQIADLGLIVPIQVLGSAHRRLPRQVWK